MEYLGRRRVINDREDNEPYLERYYIFLKDRKTFPFNIFIHRFLKSDPDDLHDHPWEFRTIILKEVIGNTQKRVNFGGHQGHIDTHQQIHFIE